jgi:transcription elongation factor GreB
MSKAFTREDDSADGAVPLRQWPKVPAGAKNYLTAAGAQSLRKELNQLLEQERPRLTSIADDDGRRQLQAVDQRIAHLQQSLDTAEIVEAPPEPWTHARFGATVRVREKQGDEVSYRIVGVDEADIDRDWISWCSPLARALLNSELGKRVRFRVPAGEQELEILSIRYD